MPPAPPGAHPDPNFVLQQYPRLEHLTCFFPGLLTLGELRKGGGERAGGRRGRGGTGSGRRCVCKGGTDRPAARVQMRRTAKRCRAQACAETQRQNGNRQKVSGPQRGVARVLSWSGTKRSHDLAAASVPDTVMRLYDTRKRAKRLPSAPLPTHPCPSPTMTLTHLLLTLTSTSATLNLSNPQPHPLRNPLPEHP